MKSWLSSPEGGGLVSLSLISSLDHGFTVGDGVFETLKTKFGHPIFLERHLNRLQRSADLLEINIPDFDYLKIAVLEVLAQEEIKTKDLGRLRVTVTTGVGELGSARSDSWTLAINWSGLVPWPESARIVISDVLRNERSPLSGAKTISYAENVLALARAKKADASEALLLNLKGNVTEGTGSNIFIVKNGTVITPPLEDGILAGITRETLIEAIPQQIRFAELSLDSSDLLNADEIFLTSSTRDIQPVTQINDKEFSIGPITKQLIETYQRWVNENND